MLHVNDLEGRGQNLPEATHPEASNSSHLGHIFFFACGIWPCWENLAQVLQSPASGPLSSSP